MQLEFFQTHTTRVTQVRARTNTQQNLVRFLIVVRQIMPIARDDHRDTQFIMKTHQPFVNLKLNIPRKRCIRMAVILQL